MFDTFGDGFVRRSLITVVSVAEDAKNKQSLSNDQQPTKSNRYHQIRSLALVLARLRLNQQAEDISASWSTVRTVV